MDSCGNFVKFLLFVFNLIFALSGFGIIASGAIVLAEIDDFKHFIKAGIIAPPIVLVIVGAVVFVVAFMGCFGAIRESPGMLIGFSVCLLIIFVLEMAVGITVALYIKDFARILKETLKRSIANYSSNQNDAISWDIVHRRLKCCGVDGYGDWQGQGLPLPLSCCAEIDLDLRSISPYCISSGRGNYLHQEGCFTRLHTTIENNAKLLIGVGIGIAFVEVVGIVLACWLASIIKKEGGDEDEEKEVPDDN